MKGRWGFGRSLAVICLLGFALRVGYVVVFRRGDIPLGGDAFYYTAGANLLARGYGFVEPLSVLTGHPQQTAGHPPLYVLWLAIASLADPARNATQLVHMLWSCVLGTGTIAMCGLLGRRVAGSRCGLVAAVGAAVYPNIWLHDGMLLSETMAIFTVTLTLWSAYRFWDQPSASRVAWLGFCCALAALARPELILTVPALLLPLVVVVKGVPLRRKLAWLALGGVAALATLTPWVAYNLSRFDAPVYVSTNGGGTVAAANCDSTYYGEKIGYKDYACAEEVWEAAKRSDPRWGELDQAQQDALVRRQAFRYVDDHLERVPVVVAARMARTLKLYAVGQEINYDHGVHTQELWVVYSGLATWYVVAGLAVGGAIVLRRRAVPLFPLLVVPAIVLLAVAATFSQTRYRAPAEPALVVLAAVAVDAVLAQRRAGAAADIRAELPAEEPATVPAAV